MWRGISVGRRLAPLLTIAGLAAAAAPVLPPAPATAATFPPGFTDATIASGLGEATALAQLPGGRILVTAQGGALTIVSPTNGAKTPVTGVPPVCSDNEQGLLGVAVDPDYTTNNHI